MDKSVKPRKEIYLGMKVDIISTYLKLFVLSYLKNEFILRVRF